MHQIALRNVQLWLKKAILKMLVFNRFKFHLCVNNMVIIMLAKTIFAELTSLYKTEVIQ